MLRRGVLKDHAFRRRQTQFSGTSQKNLRIRLGPAHFCSINDGVKEIRDFQPVQYHPGVSDPRIPSL